MGAVADLPHVVGRVSDLDAAHASRALAGLRAELHRRERLVAAAGARDLAELDPLDPRTPARLLVVVDEFRALADELPESLPALARLAAQGRSLGMHLVLATQRPAGAVTPTFVPTSHCGCACGSRTRASRRTSSTSRTPPASARPRRGVHCCAAAGARWSWCRSRGPGPSGRPSRSGSPLRGDRPRAARPRPLCSRGVGPDAP
ncbi:hypothetical protein [Cellulomonas soli]